MRKRYRVLLFAALLAALAVPFGFGFSLESSDVGASEPAIAATVAPARMVTIDFRSTTATDAVSRELPDSAKLLLIGTVLFGVAAVVRKRA